MPSPPPPNEAAALPAAEIPDQPEEVPAVEEEEGEGEGGEKDATSELRPIPFIEKLPHEVLHRVFVEVDHPGPLAQASKYLYEVSQDPYMRSTYFLQRYGPLYAFWGAFSRSASLTEEVIDNLYHSGAHISRYLTQMVVHSFTRAARIPGCPRSWACATRLKFAVFAHFLKLSATLYPKQNCEKGEDDGTLFMSWIHTASGNAYGRMKRTEWKTVEDIFQHGFIPFSPEDDILRAFPTALALNYLVIPLAKKNGFIADKTFNDTCCRKIFSVTGNTLETDGERALAIARAIKEVIDLDPDLYVSKTVAGEVLMEIETRPAAMSALKLLDGEGYLRFDLAETCKQLIKTFRKTRSIVSKSATITTLYAANPAASDAIVREVVFVSVLTSRHEQDWKLAKLEELELLPIGEEDAIRILSNEFTDRTAEEIQAFLVDHADLQIESYLPKAVLKSVTRVAKGKFLSFIRDTLKKQDNVEGEEGFKKLIGTWILKNKIKMTDLFADPVKLKYGEKKPKLFKTKIAYDYEGRCDPYQLGFGRGWSESDSEFDEDESENELDEPMDETVARAVGTTTAEGEASGAMDQDGQVNAEAGPSDAAAGPEPPSVASATAGAAAPDGQDEIHQQTLTSQLAVGNVSRRGRRSSRWARMYGRDSNGDNDELLPYPADSLPTSIMLGDWYGPNHAATKILFEHALINGNARAIAFLIADGVLLTTRHFRLLARLGRAPIRLVWERIEIQRFVDEKDDEEPEAEEEDEVLHEKTTQAKTKNRRTSTASIKSKMDVDEPVESAVAAVPSTSAISPPLATTTTEASALPYAARESSPLTDDPDDALPFASSSAPKSRSLRRTSRAVKKTYEDDEDEDEFSKADDEEEFAEETDEDEKSKAKGRKKAPAAAKGGKGKGKAAAAAYLKAGGGGKGGKTTKLSRADKERMKWIKFLTKCLKIEDAAVKVRQKETKAIAVKEKRKKEIVHKTEFHRNLINHLDQLCRYDTVEREESNRPIIANYHRLPETDSDDETSSEDDEPATPMDEDVKGAVVKEEVGEASEEEDDEGTKVAAGSKRKRGGTSAGEKGKGKDKASSMTTKKPKPTPKKTKGNEKASKASTSKTTTMTPAASGSTSKPKKTPATKKDVKGKGRAKLVEEDEDDDEDELEEEESELSELSDEEKEEVEATVTSKGKGKERAVAGAGVGSDSELSEISSVEV